MANLKGLTQLGSLGLQETQVTDAGVGNPPRLAPTGIARPGRNAGDRRRAGVNLQGLTKLRTLDLGKTKITDAGLANLKGLTQLGSLGLQETQVTDAGVESSKACPNWNR